MTYEFLQSLYKDLLLMMQGFTVKRSDFAKEGETTESALAFELYYACLQGSRYFYNFQQFDIDILEKYLSPADVTKCYYNVNEIPENLRDAIVEEQSARVINNYEEQNEYYRMLSGLPEKDDHAWIYITDKTGIPADVPIHQLSIEQISHLEVDGYLDQLIADNPDKKYLGYLGINAIDFVTARLAKPFEILRMGNPSNSNTKTMFENEYYKARRYILATFYNQDLFTSKTLYDPTIGVLIVCLAIRNTMVPTEAEYLNFDEILNAILESYGLLRYFEKFPFTFKRRLVMALDAIIQNKGTDGVLVDICKIFSFDNFTARRYYLMKTQTKDADGNVVFTGDVEKDFDLNFIKSAIEDHEINYTGENVTPYEQVVNNDYLWQLTEEERHKVMNEDFNLMMSKYIDIEAAYDLSALTFEVCCFINMILSSRDNELKIRCTNMYATGGSSNIYTMILFLLAGLAKKSNFDGNIVYDTTNIAEVMRFNTDEIRDAVSEIVKKYELDIDVNDTVLPDYDSPPELDKPLGIINDQRMVDIYIYNRTLYQAILKELHTTTDMRKYIALSNAKDCMYYSHMQKQDFVKADGSNARTYYEMLFDVDPKLALKLDSIDPIKDYNELDKLLLYILEKLEDLFSTDELKYLFLNTPNTYGSLIAKYLRTAINVFKASSVQLDSINVIFQVGDSDPIRVIDEHIRHKKINVNDTVYITDEVAFHKTIVVEDTIRCMDKGYTNQ